MAAGNAPPAWHSAPEPWEEFGACAGQGHDRFFDDDDPTEAKAVCAGCPVVEPCRTFALAGGASLFGVWGGTTRRERINILKARRRGAA